MRIGRVELHEVPEENGRDICHAQGRARMTALGLLHGIHGKKPDAVGHIPQVLVAGLGDCLDGRSGRGVSHDWRFLVRWIGWGKGSGGGFVGAQTGGDPTRKVSGVARALAPAIQKPEDSDSFRLTIYRRSRFCWSLRPCPSDRATLPAAWRGGRNARLALRPYAAFRSTSAGCFRPVVPPAASCQNQRPALPTRGADKEHRAAA